MRGWVYMLGGLLVWSVHFAGIYAAVSLAAQTPAADTAGWQAASLVFSVACFIVASALLFVAARRARSASRGGLPDHLAALGALVGGVGIAWQAAAPLFSPAG